jgi:hypothetical protein
LDASDNSALLAVNIAPLLATIESWRQTHFGSSVNIGTGADTNVVTIDGLPNLMKYAFGLDPNTENAAADLPRVSDSLPFTITFRRAREPSDVTILVQGADNLNGVWTNIWNSATNAFGAGTNDHEVITVTDPVPVGDATSGRFLRLNVTRP